MRGADSFTIGFVGLGIMGAPMAQNMARKFPVIGFDVQASRMAAVTGITRAASAAEVARTCDVVCLSLPSAAVVEQVVLADGGLASELREGSLLIDLSTSLPSVSRRIAARLAERGVQFADAPVSGGEKGAKDGTLAIMAGASAPVFERCRPILEAIGKTAVRVGDVGAGNIAKLVNNMIVAAEFAVIAEGFALAAREGVDARLLYDAMREGWAGSRVLDVSAEAISERRYVPGGTIDMLVKDISYAQALAAESHASIPMTAAAHEILVAGQAAGYGKSSQPAIYELWNRTEAKG
ncbi:MAG TPA: NAD(P)-binding domain-containing protein [Spirochaetia bacterium]|nr:NAD(P)-binding domain-containing protein [Spirochaetia bacterium]